jgi:hypothetical protein
MADGPEVDKADAPEVDIVAWASPWMSCAPHSAPEDEEAMRQAIESTVNRPRPKPGVK